MRKKFLYLSLVLCLAIGMAVPAQAEVDTTVTAAVTIGGDRTEYTNFLDAWNAADGHEATLELLEDVTLEASQTPLKLTSGAVTLEMADVKIYCSYTNSDAMLEVSEGAALILNSGTIQCGNRGAVDVSGELTVNGGSILSNSFSRSNAVTVSGGKLTIENGLIEASGDNTKGVMASGAELTVRGGIIRCPDVMSCALTAGMDSKVIISDGLIEGKIGAIISAGTLEISGGTIKGETSGLTIDSDCSAHLSGGDFYGANSVCNYNFGAMISDMLVAGYAFQKMDDKAWLVDTGDELEGNVTVQKAPVKIEQEPQGQTKSVRRRL